MSSFPIASIQDLSSLGSFLVNPRCIYRAGAADPWREPTELYVPNEKCKALRSFSFKNYHFFPP